MRWVRPQDLGAYPFPAANARIIAALLEHLGLPPIQAPDADQPLAG